MLKNIVAVEMVPGLFEVRSDLVGICYFLLRWEQFTHSVKYVALGSGLATTPISNIRLESEELKFRASRRPSTSVSLVMFLPSCGRNPWFASVFIIGHGPRTICISMHRYCSGPHPYNHCCQLASNAKQLPSRRDKHWRIPMTGK